MNGDLASKRSSGAPFWTIGGVIVLGWILFTQGHYLGMPLESTADSAIAYSPVALLVLIGLLWFTRDRWYPAVVRLLERHTDHLDALPVASLGLWIAVAAGLGLFAELMLIRVHASYFQLFAYFKNVSLLSCFLGLGLGYTLGPKGRVATPLVLPLLVLQIGAMYWLRYQTPAEALQNPVSEQFAFGIRQASGLRHFLSAYGFMAAVFAFNALCFVPLGHLVSRLMRRIEKLPSYSWNLVGSLAGIALFYLLSYLWTPPLVWLAILAVALAPFLVRPLSSLVPSGLALIIGVGVLSLSFRQYETDIFSPYQILTLNEQPGAPVEIRVNNVYYQRMLDLASQRTGPDAEFTWRDHYDLPYHFTEPGAKVLIVGSGTGNDVAAAVRNAAGQIDAVEIDPAILKFGEERHPAAPYQAENVTAHVADARAFIRRADERYDLIVYGLLDSHTLLSGLSGVRLDSYVYTVEGFREARSRLRDGGLIVLTFSVIGFELGRKLYLMLEEAFDGQQPVVLSTKYDRGYTFLIGETMDRSRLQPPEGLNDVTPVFASPEVVADVSTDDWPFFYMPLRTYPASYIVMILMLLLISLLFVKQLAPGSSGSWSAPCFFLGAGFMLIETKGITELALVYGSTWVVVGAVIAAILVLAFLANLVVIRWGAPRPSVTYGLLVGSLILGMVASRWVVAGLGTGASQLVLPILLTLPLFFSGVAFSTELKRSSSVAVALSSNLLGAMLGGFLEYNSMYFGFRSLYFLAIAMYLLAFGTSIRTRVASPV
jgi:spermidine synthase